MFTYFQDRDGKFQLAALAESGFGALRRSTRFMLTEEAHHLFVGDTGIGRICRRSAQLAKETGGDVRSQGGIPLELIQKYINFWFSSALDLFGGEISSNAADAFAAGLKGRFNEEKKYEDHSALEGSVDVPIVEGGRLVPRSVPLRNALNEVLRSEYVSDSVKAIKRWNKVIAGEGVDFELTLPHNRFHRRVGEYATHWFDYEGNLVSQEQAEREVSDRLPSDEERAYVKSLMVPVTKPGEMANWIAPPKQGIHGQPLDFEYVKLH
jgi:benzoyl-CoA 2,3-dioxygenase component B